MTRLLIGLSLMVSIHVMAQTAPPIPEATPPQGPAPQAEMTEVKSKIKELYDEFRSMKKQLPFNLNAGMYLFYYQPLSYTTFSPTDQTGYIELYVLYMSLDKEWKGLGGHVEFRLRDGGHLSAGAANNYLRGFFSSNVWFQEVYAYYKPWSILNIKFGKIYRKTGIFWDDSFFGNLQYYDGHKLNPDWGLSIEGTRDFLGGKLGLTYAAQYFYGSDGINGSLDYGRTFGAPPDMDTANARRYSPTPEGQTDGKGNRIGQLKHVVDGRIALTARPVKPLAITLGLSGLTGTVRRSFTNSLTMMGVVDEARFSQAIVDLTLLIGPFRNVSLRVLGEYMKQFGPGLRDADYVLAGARLTWRDLAVYMHASYVRYALNPSVQEFQIVPGISYAIGGGLAALVEYNEWQRRDPRGIAFPLQAANTTAPVTGFYNIDRSINFVVVYSY